MPRLNKSKYEDQVAKIRRNRRRKNKKASRRKINRLKTKLRALGYKNSQFNTILDGIDTTKEVRIVFRKLKRFLKSKEAKKARRARRRARRNKQ